jgi:predicted patatin/cPLA2 family phospholipase
MTTSGGYWREDHPVLQALWRRRDTGDKDDGLKIGLAVEGGGMRAVISGGMITALDDAGLTEAFDVVYGSSAGALNAAFMLTGDCHMGLTIYSEDLPTRDFIDFTRPLRGKSIMDLDYVFDEVLSHRKPLDYERALASDVQLAIAVTAVDWQATVLIRHFAGPLELEAALRASCWLPGAVRGTTTFRGERVIDGNVLTAHPWELALSDGCTHILSLSTHPILEPRRYRSLVLKNAMRYLDRIEPGLGEGYKQSLEVNQRHLPRLRRWMTDPDPAPYVLDLGPLPGAPPIKRHATDRPTILDSAAYGYDLMTDAVDRVSVPVGG